MNDKVTLFTLLAIRLNLGELTVAEHSSPVNIPPITTTNDTKRAFQSSDLTTSSE
jgi:hypothetical protein